MTRAPAGVAERVAATGNDDPFGDRFPTQPIAVRRYQAGPVRNDRHTHAPDATSRPMSPAYRQPPPSWHDHAASTGGASHRGPVRKAAGPTRLTVLIVMAVAIAAVTGTFGYQTLMSSSPWGTSDAPARSAPASKAASPDRQPDDVPGRPPPPGSGDWHGDRGGALGEADGAVPDGLTVFDDDVPAVANLDAGLLKALRQAATDAEDDRVEFVVNSGWRSPEYQEHLLDEAISKYGSKKEAARWVATADTSAHVSGEAVDIGPTGAAAWLSEHGADYGLCQIYRNEPWHFELRPDAVDRGCPRMYPDPTHDPRMQQ
jgi:zinc D-Ala-D-Ala carboxypeptidase